MRELAVLLAAAIALIVSPYLASLTITAPDRELRSWWRPQTTSRPRYAVTGTGGVRLAVLGGRRPRHCRPTSPRPVSEPCLPWSTPNSTACRTGCERAGVAGAALLTVAARVDERWHNLGRAALAALAVGAFFYLLALASPRSVGLGDVKLAALVAGFLAWRSWLTAFAGLAGGFLAAARNSASPLLSLLLARLHDRSRCADA